ncbi:MAG: isoprenylcysteine carboxylmethyltransferase family protein [Ruminococcaceae bacterium]|nr:isoprenylcysteine carboxylmethyltransferase family protein [Oscillospiraceae bacterium]
MKLLVKAFIKFAVGLLLVGALLFIPGGYDFPNAWLFIALLFIPMLILGAVLYLRAPELLEKRLDVKEKQGAQKGVVGISALIFIAGFTVAGLDNRFSWSNVPDILVIVASAVLLISYVLYAEVMRENAYLSRTVKVEDGQKVVDTGLYAIVRHPMYSVTLWLFLSIPIVLGSYFSLICFLPYVAAIVVRIINEEKLLEKELDGYTEYKKKVKYRLLPFIW